MVECRSCGRELPDKPFRLAPCPNCDADVGSQCERPSGHRCRTHVPRERLVLALTDFGPCPENGGESGPEAAQKVLDSEYPLESTLAKVGLDVSDLEPVADGEWPLPEAKRL